MQPPILLFSLALPDFKQKNHPEIIQKCKFNSYVTLPFQLFPYNEYFRMEPIQEFLGKDKVIMMHEFMEELAPLVWPPEKRICTSCLFNCYLTASITRLRLSLQDCALFKSRNVVNVDRL